MSTTSGQITVGTSPTRLDADEGDAEVGKTLTAYNLGAAPVSLGNAAVTTSTGFTLPAGGSYSADLSYGDALYGVVASGTCRVDVIRHGV